MMKFISTATPLASAAEPRSRFTADAACAGSDGKGRRRAKSQSYHWPESDYRSGSASTSWLKSASTNGFEVLSRVNFDMKGRNHAVP